VRRALPLAALAAVVLAGCGGSDATPAPRQPGSTLEATWRDPTGAGVLQRGPGEPLRDRTALLHGAPAPKAGKLLGSLVQVTDAHVRDEESPARVPFLDRLGGPFTSTFRPQETLTTQVLAAALRSARAQHPEATLVTGDLIDNDQENELRMALETLKGGRVDPNSGGPGYQGVQQADDPDPSYYRPDVDPPRLPGLLARAQRPFQSPGAPGRLALLPGNHDLLLAGEVAANAATAAVATGDRELVQPDRNLRIPRAEGQAAAAVDRLLKAGRLPGRTVHVTPDPTRRPLTAAQWLAQVRAAHATPSTSGPTADAVVDLGPQLRLVLLDVTRRDGTSGGRIEPGQLQFLQRALRTSRWVLVASHQPLRGVEGAGPVLDALKAPNVLATIAGDTHHDRIVPDGRHWDITSSALADWPQQIRLLRVRATAGGGAVIETSKLDTAPDPLADDARELAYLDAQGGRPDRDAGTPLDRNVRLYVPPRP
jgi:3',5'-cyclic AMP phosphodiesterase CpdA